MIQTLLWRLLSDSFKNIKEGQHQHIIFKWNACNCLQFYALSNLKKTLILWTVKDKFWLLIKMWIQHKYGVHSLWWRDWNIYIWISFCIQFWLNLGCLCSQLLFWQWLGNISSAWDIQYVVVPGNLINLKKWSQKKKPDHHSVAYFKYSNVTGIPLWKV